jgi:hypothetical protein
MLEPPVAPESELPPVPAPPVPLPPIPLPAVPLPVSPPLPDPAVLDPPPAPLVVVLLGVPVMLELLEVGLPVVLACVPPLVAPGPAGVGVEFSPLHAATTKEPKIQARQLRFICPHLPSRRCDEASRCTVTGSSPPRMTGGTLIFMAGRVDHEPFSAAVHAFCRANRKIPRGSNQLGVGATKSTG